MRSGVGRGLPNRDSAKDRVAWEAHHPSNVGLLYCYTQPWHR